MWFHDESEIPQIAVRGGTSVFVVPEEARIEIPQALMLEPEEKTTITIEQVRKVTASLGLKQTTDRLVVIRPADKLGIEAANALLKNLEEPGEKVHYVLITATPAKLPQTILSRAAVYFLKPAEGFDLTIKASEQKKQLAKRLIAARPADLVEIAENLAKKKPARTAALEILGLTIEMLQKSYFITGKEVFIQKIPKFLTAYENISKNGHVKLHIVADLC
ncbi:hypothetical protein IKF89_02545 [Candidatus Saccharibacteria bacterium]|nr:hypothetical protein [Candidatus Saccharibacteria bacterium]